MSDPLLNYYLALVHFPVYNKQGKVVISSITNLDIHDLSRLVKTFKGRAFYMVTPVISQQAIIERIIEHWKRGFGATYNPNRVEALELVRVANSIGSMVKEIQEETGKNPILVATSARNQDGKFIEEGTLGRVIKERAPTIILLGTGWGLAREVIETCHYLLKPIEGVGYYNHLSVRCAAAIILDRVLGRREGNG